MRLRGATVLAGGLAYLLGAFMVTAVYLWRLARQRRKVYQGDFVETFDPPGWWTWAVFGPPLILVVLYVVQRVRGAKSSASAR